MSFGIDVFEKFDPGGDARGNAIGHFHAGHRATDDAGRLGGPDKDALFVDPGGHWHVDEADLPGFGRRTTVWRSKKVGHEELAVPME